MKQIRKSVFETNSSSSHSLTLGTGVLAKQPFSKEVLRSGVVSVEVGEFGWDWYRFYKPLNKLQYLLTQITDGCISLDNREALVSDDNHFAMLSAAVREHTGCELVPMVSSGYIDHQSARSEAATGMSLFKDVETLKNFIFDENSYIQTGNDNSDSPWHIGADRGAGVSKYTYESNFRDVPKDSVSIVLNEGTLLFEDSFITKKGVVLSVTFNRELFNAVKAQGVVTGVVWECGGSYNTLDYYQGTLIRDHLAKGLASTEDSLGPLMFTRDIEVSGNYDATRLRDRRVISISVPAALQASLSALPKTPMVLREFSCARLALERATESIGERWHDPKAYAALLAKVDKLKATAAKKGLL